MLNRSDMVPLEGVAETRQLSPLDAGRKVVAFVIDDTSTDALRGGLASVADEIDLRRGTVRQAIRYFEKEVPTQAVIVDIAGVDDPQSALDDLARVCPPDVQVFVIGDNTDIGFYRMLVHDLGITEYLPKPLTRDAVQRLLLSRLFGGGSEVTGSRGGHIVVVCGARGGVGTTSIAVNLAVELSNVAKGHVALLDLHLQGGTCALMLAGNPGPGLRIALEDGERVDSLFLERTAITIESRLRLIAAEEQFDTSIEVTDAGVARVLDLLNRKFNFVVVDLPMPLPLEMQSAILMARQVVVVMGPDVASVRDAKAIRGFVTSATGTDRTITVLNRADTKGGLHPRLIEKGLGIRPDMSIPDLGRRMLESVNLGVPALRRVPSLRRHLATLVREVAGIQPAAGINSLVRRVLGS